MKIRWLFWVIVIIVLIAIVTGGGDEGEQEARRETTVMQAVMSNETLAALEERLLQELGESWSIHPFEFEENRLTAA